MLAITAVLNLWGLGINGWANTYYSAAVRSMASSWHNFLFASLDPSSLMTLDKPPLAFWVQALSARIFGFHPLSLLVPQALMGVVAVALLYDLTRSRFGRAAGFVAGLALATTPIIVAVSRHNNPDELLVLCSVAAIWCVVRALERGSIRWLVAGAVCVGLGFETKMGVALLVVPGIVAAWWWTAPRTRGARTRGLLAAGGAGAAVALAWPLLVTLTPASDRPWISGTSDNSIWSLIFGYNGLGRVAGQAGGPPRAGGGGPGGGVSSVFGGPTGPFRLLESGLGDQAGWLLGLALVAALALVVVTRLRRADARTGWLLAVGGALASSAVVFSFASGIFHPYYVSFFAPYAAALVGAGTGLALSRRPGYRLLAPLMLAGGAATEAVVLSGLNGQMGWGWAAVGLTVALALALALRQAPRARAAALAVAVAALLAAPAAWAVQTLGHATSATFPAGGAAGGAAAGGGPGGGFGFGRGGRFAGGPAPGPAGGPPAGLAGGPPAGVAGGPPAGVAGRPPAGLAGRPPAAGGRSSGFGGGPSPFGANNQLLRSAISYARSHGGGTIGVASQSSAAQAILTTHADVAGLGGFSGRESSVSVSWLAGQVAAGHLRWILVDAGGGALPGDTRAGSTRALAAVERACRAVKLPVSGRSSAQSGLFGAPASTGTGSVLYDCSGRAAGIVRASSS